MVDEPKFVDAEQYGGSKKDELSFRQIVLQHLQKILVDSNVEYRGGYWDEKLAPSGQFSIRTYISDSREIYINVVDSLADILYAHFDKQMKEAEEKLNDEVAELRKQFFDDTGKPKENVESADVRFTIKKLNIKRKLFRELCNFLKRNHYLETRSFDEET